MSDSIIKGKLGIISLMQRALIPGPIDKYVDRPGPFEDKIFETYSKLEELLKETADEILLPQQVNLIPYPGVISGPRAKSQYIARGCLIENLWLPTHDGGVAHRFILAGTSKKTDSLRKTLKAYHLGFYGTYDEGFEGILDVDEIDLREIGSLSIFSHHPKWSLFKRYENN